jgi:hypothetical protein
MPIKLNKTEQLRNVKQKLLGKRSANERKRRAMVAQQRREMEAS